MNELKADFLPERHRHQALESLLKGEEIGPFRMTRAELLDVCLDSRTAIRHYDEGGDPIVLALPIRLAGDDEELGVTKTHYIKVELED